MIINAGNRGSPGDVAISNLAEAGLPASSVVRPAKIATIEAGHAERIGCLPHADRLQATEALQDSFRQALAP